MDLSILIPVYNGEKTLANTLSSLFSQKTCGFSWEIVAVDDGSRDDSLALLREKEKEASEMGLCLRALSQENRGVGKTRNRLIREAAGEYLLFVDSDDLLRPGSLQLLWDTAREKHAEMVVFDAEILHPDGSTEPMVASDAAEGPMSVRDYMLSLPSPCNKLIHRRLFCETGLAFAQDIWYEDLAVIPALAVGCGEGGIFYRKQSLYLYYQSENSITRSAFSEKRLGIFPALTALAQNAPEQRTEVEYLTWFHLYRSFVWIFWEAGRTDAIREANRFLREHFPRWQKNPLIRSRHSRKERLIALLFYREYFRLIRLWKGTAL